LTFEATARMQGATVTRIVPYVAKLALIPSRAQSDASTTPNAEC